MEEIACCKIGSAFKIGAFAYTGIIWISHYKSAFPACFENEFFAVVTVDLHTVKRVKLGAVAE